MLSSESLKKIKEITKEFFEHTGFELQVEFSPEEKTLCLLT